MNQTKKKEIIRQNNAQNHALTKLIATNTHNLYAVPFFHLWSFRGIFNGVSKYFSIFQTKTSGIFCSTFLCIRAPLLSCFSIAIPLLWNISPIFFSSSRLHFISNRSDALFRSLALCMLWHAYAAFILLHIESHWIWYDSRLASRKPNEPTRKQHNSTEYIHSHKVLYIIKKRRARTHNIYISSLAHVYFYFLLTFTVFKHSNPTLKIIKIYI